MFTLDDLIPIMRSCAGDDEDVTLDDRILEVPFTELGYDSLALLELQSQIQLRYEVDLADDAVKHMTTPRRAIDYVNRQLASEV